MKIRDIESPRKPRAACRPTVVQFRYFGVDCVKYYNRSRIPSHEIQLGDGIQHRLTASPFSNWPRKIKAAAIIPVILACFRQTLRWPGSRRSSTS
jgi:hypothetical protein